MADQQQYRPIDAIAKSGADVVVKRGHNFARAFWTGEMWAYGALPASAAVEQIDFEPTHYAPLGATRGEANG